MISPTPERLKEARKDAGLTQAKAADLIHCSRGALAQWERGYNRMPPAYWELFLIKIGVLSPISGALPQPDGMMEL